METVNAAGDRERGREGGSEPERERALNSFNLQCEPDRDDRERQGDRETQGE